MSTSFPCACCGGTDPCTVCAGLPQFSQGGLCVDCCVFNDSVGAAICGMGAGATIYSNSICINSNCVGCSDIMGGITINLGMGPCSCSVLINNLSWEVVFHTTSGDVTKTFPSGLTITLDDSNSYEYTLQSSFSYNCGSNPPIDSCTYITATLTGDVYVCNTPPITCSGGTSAVSFSTSGTGSGTFVQSESITTCKYWTGIGEPLANFMAGRYLITVTNNSNRCMAIGQPSIGNISGPAGCDMSPVSTYVDCPGDSGFTKQCLQPGESLQATISVYVAAFGLDRACCDVSSTWTFDIMLSHQCGSPGGVTCASQSPPCGACP